MQFFFRRASFLLILLFAVFFCFSFIRILFYIFNTELFQTVSDSKILLSFALGWRFDLSAVIQINALFILFYSFPVLLSQHRWTERVLKPLFLCTNLFFLFMGLSDTKYFPFIQGHISTDIIYIFRDAADQFGHLLFDYWPLSLPLVFIGFGLSKIYSLAYNRFLQNPRPKASAPVETVFFFFIISFSILAYRGGFQNRVLGISHSQILGTFETSALMLNAPFTFLRGFFRNVLEEKQYFKNQEELRRGLSPSFCAKHSLGEKPEIKIGSKLEIRERPKNVMIIILESFGPEFIGAWNHNKSYTPFYDSLSKKGAALFLNAYANGHRSIQILPSLMASLPNWLPSTLVKTRYINTKYPSLGRSLKKHGYRTLFLHGGHLGTMFFNTITPYFGLDEYYGYEQFPEHSEETDDGAWGIFDEPFFLYSVDMINKDTEKPFLAVLFSVSSHHPFVVPKKYAAKFPEGPTPLYKSIAYTDYSLRRLFKKIYQQTWAKDTLFVITPDHTPSTGRGTWNQNAIVRRQIPILYYWPGHSLSFLKTDLLTQQLDIFPTVLDILGIQEKGMLPFGRSLLAECKERHVIFFVDPYYWLLIKKRGSPKRAFLMSPSEESLSAYLLDGHDLQATKTNTQQEESLLKRLKANIQHYNNGLLYNRLSLDSGY